MKTDEEYDAVLKELRAEVALRLNLSDEATEMIPAVDPAVIRHYANRFAAMGATKPPASGGAEKAKNGAGDANKNGSIDPVKMHKRLDQLLGAQYQVPEKR